MKSLINKLCRTSNDLAPLILRLTLALVILPHGLQKTVGLFGGYGFTGTMGFFTGTLGLPSAVAFLVILCESAGSIALALGFLTRFCAASLAVVMAGAAFMGHLENGFFMNWYGNQKGEGFEYHLLAIGASIALVIAGAGKASIDRKIAG